MSQQLRSPLLLEYRGQYVFAARKIKKGEALECSPVIPIPEQEWRQVSQTVLRFYGYAWGEDRKDAALALGRGSLFRHCEGDPSTHYVNDLEGMVTVFYAARDMEQGEEITVCRRHPGQPGHSAALERLGGPGNGAEPLHQNGLIREQETRLLSIQHSLGKGRGVYARSLFSQGGLIESAVVLFIPAGEWICIKNTVLSNYWFSFGPNKEDVAIALGYGSLFNHSYTPNAVYEVKENEMTILFKALRQIEQGEEILINYNRAPGDRSPLWFDVLP